MKDVKVPKTKRKTALNKTICQMVPVKNSLCIKVTKYLVGMIFVNSCKTLGMELIGKVRPDNKREGKKPIESAL